MEYNEEQEKEYTSRESLNRLCKEAQELRWYKRYRSGASKAWLASCYIGGCFAGIQMLKPWETANASFGRALLEYGAVILSGLLFGAGFYLLSYFVYMFFSSDEDTAESSRKTRLAITIILLLLIPFFVVMFFFMPRE